MSLPGGRGLRAAGGLRAAWERQQQAAQLAAGVRRIPHQTSSKPAFLAAQLGPVVAALRQAAADAEVAARAEEAAAAEAGRLAAAAALPAAAAHLRRLQGIDAHAGANASLLLWLLLERAAEGGGEVLAGPLLLPLAGALGWQELLLGALPLLPPAQRERLEAGLVAAASAAAASSDAAPQQHLTVAQQLVAALASTTEQQLEEYRGGAPGGAAAPGELLASMALLQQLLLVCPAAAPGGALQGLRAAADACMASLMQAMQQQQQGAEARQAVFQQLCQLRARLMLASAAAGEGDSAAAPGSAVHLARRADGASGRAEAGEDAWTAVLQMPRDVAAAAGRAASSTPAPQVGLHLFLAARLAASCYLQGIGGSSDGSDGGSAPSGEPLGLLACTPALPGVRLQLPVLPGAGSLAPIKAASSGSADASALAAAAQEAAAELARDPNSLGPQQRALAALQLAELASDGAEGAAAACVMLELAAAAAAAVGDPRCQRQLLLLALHGQQRWQQRLRRRLAAHAELQRRTRLALVAVTNQLASDAGQAGSAVVHGEERRRRTAAAVAALLPHALLCPGAVLDRLVREALVQQGSQVDLLLDVLREMRPLALWTEQEAGGEAGRPPPLLLALLAQQLGGSDAAALATQGSRDACLQLVGGLCGAAGRRGHAAAAAGATAAAAAGAEDQLFAPAEVLQHVVAPALEQSALPGQQAVAPERLQLLLHLTQLLLQGSGGAPHEASAAQRRRMFVLLEPQVRGLLDLDRRRADRSASALTAGAETLELAASTLQQLGGRGGASGSPTGGASAYFQQQLAPLLGAGAAVPPRQQLQRLRRGMLQLLAALLPCCTAGEGREVLGAALPAAIQAALMPPAASQQPAGGSAGSAILPGAHAAAVEAACRAALALALHPEQAPLAGEEPTASSGAAGSAAPHSALRRAAVERALQHLTLHCARLAAAGSDCAAAAAAKEQEEGPMCLRLGAAEGQALGLRCFRELCQLAAALQPAGYDCSTLQAGLLRLAQVLKATPDPRSGAEVVPPPPQQLLSHTQVAVQLAATADALPVGPLRDVVLLAASGGSA